ncbi:MAG TPA: YhjD/YihY/BrkB family envelope integrity protein [Acidimicrobiales bacterium]|nr:YhjD/YihY/BrkB family envelope integrity protein [Acidimicrobiales bacterium]
MDPAPTQPTTDDAPASPDDGSTPTAAAGADAQAGAIEAGTEVPKKGIAKLRHRADVVTGQGKKLVDDTRATVPPVDIGFSAVERDNHIGGFLLAGAIAFRLFVFVLPMYLLALVIAGAIFAYDPDSTKDVADSAGMSKYMASSIGDAAQTSHKSLWLLIPVTLYAMISAGRSVEKAIAAAHARAWSIPLPKRKPHYVVLGVFGFALSVLTATRIVSVIRHGALVPVSMVLGAAIYFTLWLLASMALPRREGVTWWSLIPGAVLMGTGTQALYLFNVLYLNHKIQSASAAYGALGVAASALLWLYLLGRLMVASPVLNATIWQRQHDPDGALSPNAGSDLPGLSLGDEPKPSPAD